MQSDINWRHLSHKIGFWHNYDTDARKVYAIYERKHSMWLLKWFQANCKCEKKWRDFNHEWYINIYEEESIEYLYIYIYIYIYIKNWLFSFPLKLPKLTFSSFQNKFISKRLNWICSILSFFYLRLHCKRSNKIFYSGVRLT